ncbi:hypothetical protein VTK26DRAFT_3961 [Humicola hyalothermophila]
MSDRAELQPYMLNMIHRAFTVVKPSTFTLHHLTEDGPDNTVFCFSNLLHNPGVLHSTLFTAQTFHDLYHGKVYGERSTTRMRQRNTPPWPSSCPLP